jgi:hypothetical protein
LWALCILLWQLASADAIHTRGIDRWYVERPYLGVKRRIRSNQLTRCRLSSPNVKRLNVCNRLHHHRITGNNGTLTTPYEMRWCSAPPIAALVKVDPACTVFV